MVHSLHMMISLLLYSNVSNCTHHGCRQSLTGVYFITSERSLARSHQLSLHGTGIDFSAAFLHFSLWCLLSNTFDKNRITFFKYTLFTTPYWQVAGMKGDGMLKSMKPSQSPNQSEHTLHEFQSFKWSKSSYLSGKRHFSSSELQVIKLEYIF